MKIPCLIFTFLILTATFPSFSAAERLYCKVNKTPERDYSTLLNEAQECVKNKKYQEAVRLYGKLLKFFPDDIQIHYLRGILNHKLGRLNSAMADYEFLEKHSAADYKIFNNMGVIRAAGKRFKDSEAYFKKALEKEPGQPDARNNLTKIFMETKNYDAAIEEYRRIIEANPRDAQALYNLGTAYMGKADYLKAKECWENVLEINPGDKNAKNGLGYLAAMESKKKKQDLN